MTPQQGGHKSAIRCRSQSPPAALCAHSFRGTGITEYLRNGGALEVAARIAGARVHPHHAAPQPFQGGWITLAQHSADGFAWGDGGCGPAQLALALLLRAADHETSVAHYQAFKWEVVAKLPQADFSLRLATVREWLAARTGC